MHTNQRRWSRFGFVFIAAIVLYAMVTFLAWLLGAVVVNRFPENHEWQIRSALKKGDVNKAEQVARARVADEYYDFGAHRLLATVLLKQEKAGEAVETLLMSLERMRTASGRNVFTRGADPAATYQLLSSALESQGRSVFAGEAARIAEDYNSISSTGGGSDSNVETPDDQRTSTPELRNAQKLDLEKFTRSSGMKITSSGTLRFTGNSTAKAVFHVLNSPTELLILTRGEKALGLGGILRIAQGDHELVLAYSDKEIPSWLIVPLEKGDVESTLPLTLEFLNDGFDPVTKSDRNVEVLQLFVR